MTYTRAIDAQTGQLLFDTIQHTWPASPAPMRDVVVRVLRTPRGSCLASPSFGLDYSKLDKASPQLAATFEAAALAALAYLTSAGLITDVRTLASVERSTLRYTVTFRDPNLSAPQRITDRIQL